jgi:hypothetical protein
MPHVLAKADRIDDWIPQPILQYCYGTHHSQLPRSRSQKKKSAQALQSVGDELIERCDQYRRTVGCMRPELREAHPAIVGWSTRNRPFFPRPINDRMASRSQRNWVVSGVAASPSVRTGSLGTQLA